MKNLGRILSAIILALLLVIVVLLLGSNVIKDMTDSSSVGVSEESVYISHSGPAHVVVEPDISVIQKDYQKVSSFAFSEYFGTTPSTICNLSYKGGILSYYCRRQMPDKYTLSISEDEFQGFVEIIKKYHVFEWRPSIEYSDLDKGADALNILPNPDAEYLKMGDFYCVSSETGNELYMGLSGEERLARNSYSGEWWIYVNNDQNAYVQQYPSYGVPENYNEFRDELWDYALKLLAAPDWRKDVDQHAREGLTKDYPYIGEYTKEKPDYKKIWYFSLNEFYGGFDSGIYSSLTFDADQWSTSDVIGSAGKLTSADHAGLDVYYMDKNGVPQLLYKQNKDIDVIMKKNIYLSASKYIDEKAKQKLIEILEKYNITQWKEEDFYAALPDAEYVKQGEFFNLSSSPNTDYIGIDEEEYKIRSTYKSFIYLNDTDGRRWMISYDNLGVPEEYNAFRQELWDYAVEEYAVRPVDKGKYDRRTYLDEEGRAYLEWKKAKHE